MEYTLDYFDFDLSKWIKLDYLSNDELSYMIKLLRREEFTHFVIYKNERLRAIGNKNYILNSDKFDKLNFNSEYISIEDKKLLLDIAPIFCDAFVGNLPDFLKNQNKNNSMTISELINKNYSYWKECVNHCQLLKANNYELPYYLYNKHWYLVDELSNRINFNFYNKFFDLLSKPLEKEIKIYRAIDTSIDNDIQRNINNWKSFSLKENLAGVGGDVDNKPTVYSLTLPKGTFIFNPLDYKNVPGIKIELDDCEVLVNMKTVNNLILK